MPQVACPKCQHEFDSGSASCPNCGEAVSAFVRQHAGSPVDGKYRIIKQLGRGGMGEVFKVEHVHLGATRVIKVMRPHIADQKELQDRFIREARLATRIQHPNVGTLHDFSILPDNSCYMVWEYIEGTDLGTYAKGVALSTRHILELMIQVLHGLEAIHNAGIVHRDISPENIMVSVSDAGVVAKVIDLGIAKSDSADGALTSTGVFIGKWRYASPEHLGLLESGETIDGRADLFSIGIVLYELLAGQLPFQAETPGQYVLLHAGEKPSPVTPDRISVPDAPGLEAVLAKVLERNRVMRQTSAHELIADLERVLAGMSMSSESPTLVLTPGPSITDDAETARTPSPRPSMPVETAASREPAGNRALMIGATMAAALALVIAAFLVYFVLQMKREGEITASASVAQQKVEPSVEPPGEVVDVPAETTPTPVASPAVTATEPATATGQSKPVHDTPPTTTQAPAPVRPPQQERPEAPEIPVSTVKPAPAVKEPVRDEVEPAAVASDTIPSSGRPLFGRRSKRLVDDTSYPSGFTKGIIRDYSDMWSRGGLDWVALAKGVQLSDYTIRVSKFRNMTRFRDTEMIRYLDDVLQEELDDVAEGDAILTTENAIFWAQEEPEYAIGIEMIFRDAGGRVVAKVRHVHFEDSLEDAAQEMVDYIVEFVEEHDVVE